MRPFGRDGGWDHCCPGVFEEYHRGKPMAREKGSRTGRCRGCNHPERVRIERLLAAGASIKGAARKFAIDYHALRRHWINHVSAEARAAYIAGGGATKDQLEAIVADESLALIDHYRIVRAGLYKGFGAASEIGDCNALAICCTDQQPGAVSPPQR